MARLTDFHRQQPSEQPSEDCCLKRRGAGTEQRVTSNLENSDARENTDAFHDFNHAKYQGKVGKSEQPLADSWENIDAFHDFNLTKSQWKAGESEQSLTLN
jgi:hypothetical protein